MSEVVSIIIPTLNRCSVLKEALASVASQSYPHWEAIVVDNGSNDGTREMLEEQTRSDPRFRFLPHEGGSTKAPAARNRGVAFSDGDYVLFLDSDDLLAPSCLERRLAAFDKHPEVAFVVGGTGIFYSSPGDTKKLWNHFDKSNDLDRFLRMDVPWQTSGPLWRRSALLQIGKWDEEALDWQDWEFHVRAMTKYFSYILLTVVDAYWRRSPDSSDKVTVLNPERELIRAKLYAKIRQILIDKNLMTSDRDRMLVSASANLVRRHLYRRNFKAADSIFGSLYAANLVRSDRKLLLKALFHLTHLPIDLLARLFIRLWVDIAIEDPSVEDGRTRNQTNHLWSPKQIASLDTTGLWKQTDG